MSLCLLTLLCLLPTAQAALEGPQQATPHVSARLVASATSAAPGETITIGLAKRIIPGWHTYWQNPGDSGLATQIEWSLPRDLEAGALQWPAPYRQPFGPVMNYGYEGEVTLLTEFAVAPDARPGDTLALQANAEWLVCSDICIPEQLTLTLALPVAGTAQGAPHPAIDTARRQLPTPSPWPVRHAPGATDNTLHLAIDSGPLPLASASVEFFPLSWGEIDHGAAQAVHATPHGILIALQAGPALNRNTPSNLQGVLVISEGGANGPLRRAFTIDAPRVEALALPARAGAAPPLAAIPHIGTGQALLLALLGGLILNLMPCVFPVLAMKIMALVQHSHGDASRVRQHGLAYLAGVVASFAILALAVLALQAGGTLLGWGFQFQSPLFVLLVAWLLFGVGLNLSGVFTVGGGAVAGLGQGLTERHGLSGSFFTGVLAALVATPCTAPFMGVAIGFAMSQPPAVLFSVFVALGLGLALPFVALAWRPALLRRLPRPGAWMLRLKQFLAFPMYAAAVWLVWVLALQSGAGGVLLALGGMVALALAAWLYEATRGSAPRPRHVAQAASAAVLVLTLAAGSTVTNAPTPLPPGTAQAPAAPGTLPFQPFSGERLARLRAEGRPVFVNFTAAWCITCLVNERVALNQTAVIDAFAAHGITYLKGDWTNQDAEITAMLAQHGRSGVPLYLYYPAGAASAHILPQILTPDLVLRALAAAPGR